MRKKPLRSPTILHLASADRVYTSDIERGKRVASRMETGMVFVNYPDISLPELPFGGIKRSGYGKELSSLSLNCLPSCV